ncbi:NTP transferase domain-containing protein [Candidatus Daviesbacteria bacterium]|nr:NTP transferase domain-containing protein [Candidatus Daviesbacteria bacterium]
MQILVLAAGEGKRMWPIVEEKYLLPFLGQPLIYHNLKHLSQIANFDQFIIVTKESSKGAIAEIAQSLNLKFQIRLQNEPTGMSDAILSAKDLLDGELVIINAEDVIEPKIFEGVVNVQEADIVLTGLQVKKYFPGGYIKKGLGDRVEGIVEKPGEGNEPSDLVKLVVDYFKDGQQLINYLQKAKSSKDDVYEVALDQMIQDGLKVRFAKYSGVWLPLKYPWHILDITTYFLSQVEQEISPGAKVSSKAIIEGKVIIEEGAKVFEGAAIKGPAYIGKNCIVGNNSMIREVDLEAGCVTGFNSDITRSYIGANCWFHTNYIGDSVIEGDFGMGSGAVLANLRLDNQTIKVAEQKIDTGRNKLGLIAGRGARIGVNASTMPGVRVGSNSLVGPGVVLHQDIKDDTKILVKQEYQTSEHTPVLTSYEQFRKKI